MFNTCCCGKYPQCTYQWHFTSRAHQKGKEDFKKDYYTGKAECTPDFTFPERAIKVTGHLQSAKGDQRAVSESRLNTRPALSLSSESHCITISIRPARGTTIPWHTFFFLLKKHGVTTVFPFRWVPETAAHQSWNWKVVVFFISQQNNKFWRINFSVALALGMIAFTLSSLKTGKELCTCVTMTYLNPQ